MPAATPDWGRAVVADAKLKDYLLAPDHPEGGPKAGFFLACGFSPDDLGEFASALVEQAQGAVLASVESPFGVKYVAEGPLTGPDGVSRRIRSVWILEPGMDGPRFVTAYPLEMNDGDR